MNERGRVNGNGVPTWRRWLQSAPVATFFLLTYIFSWGIWGLVPVLLPGAGLGLRMAIHTLGLCGPTVAALIMSALLGGKQRVTALLKQTTRWRAGVEWCLFALFSTLAVGLAVPVGRLCRHELAAGRRHHHSLRGLTADVVQVLNCQPR